jgi:hypothetical protein
MQKSTDILRGCGHPVGQWPGGSTGTNSITSDRRNKGSPEELPAASQAQIIFQMKSGQGSFDPSFPFVRPEPTCKSLPALIQFSAH